MTSLAGSLTSSPLIGYFGRKKVSIGANLISVSGLLFLWFAESVTFLYLGRILGGYAFGILFANTPLYNAEISQSRLRKFTGAMMVLIYNIGFVTIFALTTILSWRTSILVASAIPFINAILLVICPESPTWLMMGGKNDQALSLLKSLRGNQGIAINEIKRIEDNIRKQNESIKVDDETSVVKSKIKIMSKGTFIRPFIVATTLHALGWHWTGGPLLSFYTIDILEGFKIPMDPYLCGLVIACYQVGMAVISAIVSFIVPRRKLYMVCGIFETIGNLILGIMVYLNRNEYLITVEKEYPFLTWLPFVGILLYYGGYHGGYVTVTFALLAELLPSNARSIGSSITTTLSISSMFILVKFGPTLQENIGLDGLFWMFAGVTSFSIVFCYFFVPETFGMSLESIEDHYRAICNKNKIAPKLKVENFHNKKGHNDLCDIKV